MLYSVLSKEEQARNLIRIPFPSFSKILEKPMWKATLQNLKDNQIKIDVEVRDLSVDGVAIFLDEKDIDKFNKEDMAVFISLKQKVNGGEEYENILENQLARVCVDKKKTKDTIKADHILRVQFSGANNRLEKDNLEKRLKLDTDCDCAKDKCYHIKEYIKTKEFRHLVREKVQWRPGSLYKYLHLILRFVDNFVNSDLGMIGYVIHEDCPLNSKITVEDTLFIGRVDKFKDDIRNSKEQKLSELDGNERKCVEQCAAHNTQQCVRLTQNKKECGGECSDDQKENFETRLYDKNQDDDTKYSCMAHSQRSEKTYLIRYPNKKTIRSADFKEDGIMNSDDKKAASQGKYNRIKPDIIAEFTVPIKPWCKHDYGKDEKEVVDRLFDILQNLQNDLKVFSLSSQEDKEEMWKTIKENDYNDFVLVNDSIDKKHHRVLFRSLALKKSKESLEKFWANLHKCINESGNGGDISLDAWKIIIEDLQKKSEENEVIALLNFELVQPEAREQNEDQQTPPRKNGFDLKITREILEIIREEVEYEISKGMFDHYNSLRLLLYHSLTNLLMGEPHHAANELGKWREVQCSNMFRNFPPLKKIFNGYRDFLKKESHLGASEPLTLFDEASKEAKKTKEDYMRLINLDDKDSDNKDAPDMRKDGQGGIGLLHRADFSGLTFTPDELIAVQQVFIPTIQLHYILEDIDGLQESISAAKCDAYFKKACNIAPQIKREIELFEKERTDQWESMSNNRYQTMANYSNKLIDWLKKHNQFAELANPGFDHAFDYAKKDEIIQTFQQKFYDHYDSGSKAGHGNEKIKYMINHFLHMRFLIGIAQFYHIMRDRKLSPQVTFSEFEVLDGKKREFLFRFIEICSLLILSESTKRENKENAPSKKPLTVPLALAYMYRAKAFLYLGENQRAYNDFNRLERLVETTKPKNFRMDIAGYPEPCVWFSEEKAESFADWLKVLLNYQKGRVYFDSFAQSQSLVSFCRSMEKLRDFDEKYQSIPRITTINSMIYKGKGFFERGSFSRSLKWYFKAVKMIMQYLERWWSEENGRSWFDENSSSEEVWSPLQYALIKELIDLMEVFKHNAFIKKEKLALMLVLSVYRTDENKGCARKIGILGQPDILSALTKNNDEEHVWFKEEIKSERDLRERFEKLNQCREKERAPKIKPKEREQILDLWRESVYSERFKKLCDSVREQYKSNRTQEEKFPEEDECLVRSMRGEIGIINPVQRVSECLFPKIKIKGSIKKDILEKKAFLEEDDFIQLHENDVIRKVDDKGDPHYVYFDHKIKEKEERKECLKYIEERLKDSKIDSNKIGKVKEIWKQEIGKRSRCFDPMARILSDVLNRIGFILFDLRLHPEQRNEKNVGIGKLKEELIIKGGVGDKEKVADIALDWIEKAFDINPKNGFARFNQLLIKDAHGLGNDNQSKDFVQAFENEAHFHRKFYPVILHWMKQWRDGKGCVSEKNFLNKRIDLNLLEKKGIVKKDAKWPGYVYFCETIVDKKKLGHQLDISGLKAKKGEIIKIWDKSQDQKDEKLTSQEQLYSKLLRAQLMYICDLIKKPAEIYDYLTKRRTIPCADDGVDSKDPSNGLYFLGRYSSWSPKQPRPRVFSVKGGGKFLVWKGKGILIDPGFDLLNNLYAEGFSLEDIDAVIVTHDHHDHTDDFESMWRLIKEHNEVVKPRSKDNKNEDNKRKMIELTLFTNLGFEQRCSRFLSSNPKKTYVKRIYPLSKETVIKPDDFAFDIHVVKAEHKENLTDDYSIGFVLKLYEHKNPRDRENTKPIFEIGFPSDTSFHEKLTPFYDCDIVIPHISNATFRELKVELGFNKFDAGKHQQKYNNELFDEINKPDPDGSARDMKSVLKWSFWHGRDEKWIEMWRAHENNHGYVFKSDFGKNDRLFKQLIDKKILVSSGTNNQYRVRFSKSIKDKDRLNDHLRGINKITDNEKTLVKRFWLQSHCQYPGVTKSHLGASGVYKIWENMIFQKDDKGKKKSRLPKGRKKLLVLSEFREEMGSFRNKVAVLLNKEFGKTKGKETNVKGTLHCMTSDIGMAIHFTTSETPGNRRSTVQCSVCRHDNDLYRPASTKHTASYPDATFHFPDNITEVCIKGDSEGMVYLCKEHDTGPNSLFIEHMDHFNLFGHEGISL